MEWIESIRKTIDDLEESLYDTENEIDIAKRIGISSFYLQKGFCILTGYSMSEYVRNRRLYLAGLDVIAKKEKIIEIAYKYGYESPESFSKAFTRFHGLSPAQLRKEPSRLNIFLPLQVSLDVQGGNAIKPEIVTKGSFQIIGFERLFDVDTAYIEIPRYWEEFQNQSMKSLERKRMTQTNMERAIQTYCIGELGIILSHPEENGKIRYLIAGFYSGGEIPDGMVVYEIEDQTWAKFSCVGPMPGTLQAVNTKIYKEWLPGNPDYEIASEVNVEWYEQGDVKSVDYHCELWIPVKPKA